MKSAYEITALVVSNGLDVSLAVKLAETYKRVMFWVPHDDEFPKINDHVIGQGMGNIEVIEDPWGAAYDEADLWVFPDLGFGGLQLRLEQEGKIIWGARNGEEMEQDREAMKMHLESIGLQVGPWTHIKGFDALRAYLEANKDVYVKVSKWRGSWETIFSADYEISKPLIDEREQALSGVSEEIEFIVEKKIDDAIEMATDGWCIDGQFPKSTLVGIEQKDAAYVGRFMPWSEVPVPLQHLNKKLSPTLQQYGYRGFWSPETLIKDGKAFLNDPCCFSADTEILTEKGWKLFSELLPSDTVATLNPLTSHLEFHVPTQFVSYRYSGNLVSISSPKKVIDLLVTPNHAVWYRVNDVGLTCNRADDLTGKRYIPRTAKWVGHELSTFEIPGYSKQWKSLRKHSVLKRHHCAPIRVEIESWLKFIGIFLSEGSVNKWEISLSQTKYKSEFRAILEKLPFRFTENKKGFRVFSVQLASFLRNTGNRSERSIPAFVKLLSPRLINIFLDAYLLGDGHLKHGNRNISTTSVNTANDLQELFLKCGSVADIVILKKAGSPVNISAGKYTTKHDSIVIRERKRNTDFYFEGWRSNGQKYLKLVPYEGMVYDVTVPNHIVYVRRNGKPCWSGNCRIPEPPGSLYLEFFTNLAEVIWAGSQGEIVEPEAIAPIGVQLVLSSPWSDKHWNTLSWPSKYDKNVKLREACKIGGKYRSIPQDIGLTTPASVIGWGETLDEAEAMVREVAESIKATDLRVPLDAFDKLRETLEESESKGLKIL